jgi:hypothetical protein
MSVITDFKLEDNNENWTIIDKDKGYLKYNKINDDDNIEYRVSEELINKAKQYEDCITEENNQDYNIYKFYKIYDDDKSDIFYSRTTTETTILNDLINNNKGNKKLMSYKKLTDIRYKLLECYKVGKKVNTKKEFDNNKEKLKINNKIDVIPFAHRLQTSEPNKSDKNKIKKDKKINTPQETVDMIIDQYKKYIDSHIDKTREKFKYYIYKFTEQKNKLQIYIYGSKTKLRKKEIDEIVENRCINFETNHIKSEIIKEIDIYTELEGLINVDEEIFKNNTINMNKYYNIINMQYFDEQEIFMIIQQDKIKHMKNDKIDSCYIASININNKRYIYSNNNNKLYDKLNILYNMTKHNDNKHNKIIELLKITKIDNINIEILEKNIIIDELESRLIYHMNRYNKDMLLNYCDDYYVKPEELKKLSGLVFTSYNYKKKH